MTARGRVADFSAPSADFPLHRLEISDRIDYASAVRACPSGIVITDPSQPDNPIVFVNPAFTELTGYSAAEATGRNCRFLQGAETDQKVVSEIREALAAGQPIRTEILNYRKDRKSFWTALAISPTHDDCGGVVGFVGVLSDITDRKHSEATRSEADARLSGIVANMPGFVFQRVSKPDGTMKYTRSDIAPMTLAADSGKVLGSSHWQTVHHDDLERLRQEIARSISEVSPSNVEFRLIGPDGDQAWFRASSTPRRLPNGDIVWDGVGIDITREKMSESRLFSIADNMPGYVFQRIRKADGSIEFPYLSPTYARLVGHPDGTVCTATDLWARMHSDDVERAREGIERSAQDLSHLVLEFRLTTERREERWFRTYSSPKRHANGDVAWDGVGVDITAEKEVEVRLAYLAHHDPLTGLANRAQLAERLVAAIRAARKRRERVVLTFILLVDFAEINETLGTDEGNATLKSVAARISELTISDRSSTSVSLGGAEFAVLRERRPADTEVDDFAGIVMRGVAQPILIGREGLTIESCVGTAIFDPSDLFNLSDELAAAELMKRAAIALSAAHKAGPGNHRLYNEELNHRTHHRMVLRHSLRQAIDEDQLQLHYQPLVDLKTGRIVSAEALVRWNHPEFGMLRPDLFISLAEESGLIGPLGEWVLRAAIGQMKEWDAQGLNLPKIAVNISGVQLKMVDFVAATKKVLAETGADARRFELELTEGVLLEHSPETLSALGELKLLGFELVIDDFGAGHASFQYLRNFPVDKIKIDQIFVRQLVADSSDAVIIDAITALAQNLKLGLVAEGIETIEQRDFLRDRGCTTGQGYFFSLPLAAEDFGWMLEKKIALPIIPKEKQEGGAPQALKL